MCKKFTQRNINIYTYIYISSCEINICIYISQEHPASYWPIKFCVVLLNLTFNRHTSSEFHNRHMGCRISNDFKCSSKLNQYCNILQLLSTFQTFYNKMLLVLLKTSKFKLMKKIGKQSMQNASFLLKKS